MSQLDEALRRLDGAVARLESSIADGVAPGAAVSTDADLAGLQAERDRLMDEVRRLRGRAADDARLRSEAADAVRAALHDLRGAIGQHVGGMHGNA